MSPVRKSAGRFGTRLMRSSMLKKNGVQVEGKLRGVDGIDVVIERGACAETHVLLECIEDACEPEIARQRRGGDIAAAQRHSDAHLFVAVRRNADGEWVAMVDAEQERSRERDVCPQTGCRRGARDQSARGRADVQGVQGHLSENVAGGLWNRAKGVVVDEERAVVVGRHGTGRPLVNAESQGEEAVL